MTPQPTGYKHQLLIGWRTGVLDFDGQDFEERFHVQVQHLIRWVSQCITWALPRPICSARQQECWTKEREDMEGIQRSEKGIVGNENLVEWKRNEDVSCRNCKKRKEAEEMDWASKKRKQKIALFWKSPVNPSHVFIFCEELTFARRSGEFDWQLGGISI